MIVKIDALEDAAPLGERVDHRQEFQLGDGVVLLGEDEFAARIRDCAALLGDNGAQADE